MKKRVGGKEKPLMVEGIRAEMSLHFERSNTNSSKNFGVEELEEHALFSGQFKGMCGNCGQLSHKSFQCKSGSNSSHDGSNNGNLTGYIFCTYCR
jgi:hypothetical protein